MKRLLLLAPLTLATALAPRPGQWSAHAQVRGEAAPAQPRGTALPGEAASPAPARALARPSTPADVSSTRHNLSASGRGRMSAASETRVCFFCHGSHLRGGDAAGAGLSNRPDSPAMMPGYRSSTMRSLPAPPSSGTRMCLSCHDGSQPVGSTRQGAVVMRRDGSATRSGLDLRRSHPIGLRPAETMTLRRPAEGGAVQLDRRGSVECTSCHDPHREDLDAGGKFLVASNRQSAICLTCHALPGWGGGPSAHRIATRPYTDGDGTTRLLSESACSACHVSHQAADRGPLLRPVRNGADDDALCLSCHDGRSGKNIAAETAKLSAHSAARSGVGLGIHDEAERDPTSPKRLPETNAAAPRHVACADCHEPHSAYGQAQRAPFAMGALAGAWGVDRNGDRVAAVRYEYEVCFKCHGDSANKPQARGAGSGVGAGGPVRARPDFNLRRVFDLSSPSFHPVEGPGKGTDVPSLIGPLRTSSVIYCSDCHASDSAGAPRGPHGSVYPKLLAANLSTQLGTPYSAAAYALCFKCHDPGVLISEPAAEAKGVATPFRWVNPAAPAGKQWESLHTRHVRDASTPCTACHDPHGVSSFVGTAAANAHLVNFDVNAVGRGTAEYLTDGAGGGSCNLTCHGEVHRPQTHSYGLTSTFRALLRKTTPTFRGPASPAPPRTPVK